MSPRSLRFLETSLVSAFVSFGVAAAALHANAPEPPAPLVMPSCEAEPDLLAPFLDAAIAADVAFGSRDDALDEVEAYRVESLYSWYAKEHDALAAGTSVEWARSRAANLRQLQEDLATMRELEKEAKALEEAQRRD